MAIGVQAKFVVLVPVAPATVPNGSLFLDSTNGNASTIKSTSGALDVLNSAAPATNLVIKSKQAATSLAINTPVSLKTDGKIEIADANAPSGQDLIGVTLAAALNPDDLVNVLLVGANLIDALSGLGFTTGQEIYVNENGGYTNDPSTLNVNDAIVKIGVADCSGGGASPVARDLILFPDVVSST